MHIYADTTITALSKPIYVNIKQKSTIYDARVFRQYHARRNCKAQSRKQKETDRVWVYLKRLWGGGGLGRCRWFWLSVSVLRRGLVALISSVRGRDHRPGCLDRSWRIGCSHSMCYSWSLLDTVTGCRRMGVGWRRLSTKGQMRDGK